MTFDKDLWIQLLPGICSALVKLLVSNNFRLKSKSRRLAVVLLGRFLGIFFRTNEQEKLQIDKPFARLLNNLLPVQLSANLLENLVCSLSISYNDNETCRVLFLLVCPTGRQELINNVTENLDNEVLVNLLKIELKSTVVRSILAFQRINQCLKILKLRSALTFLSNSTLSNVLNKLIIAHCSTGIFKSIEIISKEDKESLNAYTKSILNQFSGEGSILHNITMWLLDRLPDRKIHLQILQMFNLINNETLSTMREYGWFNQCLNEMHALLDTMLYFDSGLSDQSQMFRSQSVILSLKFLYNCSKDSSSYNSSINEYYTMVALADTDDAIANEAEHILDLDQKYVPSLSTLDRFFSNLRSPNPSILCVKYLHSIVQRATRTCWIDLIKRILVVLNSKEIQLAISGEINLPEEATRFRLMLIKTFNLFLSKSIEFQDIEYVSKFDTILKTCDILIPALLDDNLCAHVADAIALGLKLLTEDEDRLLPFVHRCWMVIEHAHFKVTDTLVNVLCAICPDFVNRRIHDYLEKSLPIQTQNAVDRSNWLRMALVVIPKLKLDYKIASKIVKQTIEVCLAMRCNYLYQHMARNGLVKELKKFALIAEYSPLVWFYIVNDQSESISASNKHSSNEGNNCDVLKTAFKEIQAITESMN
ncbi:hypothetical protein GJ496_007626 [Pomphorhynchus laevis]|nr:hypothetical protein GJ496_007626 [Pomphorhynchus laevis]